MKISNKDTGMHLELEMPRKAHNKVWHYTASYKI